MSPSTTQGSLVAAPTIRRSRAVNWGTRKRAPDRWKGWLFPLALLGVLGSATILFALLAPLPHRVSESFTISIAEGGLCEGGPNITSSRGGPFAFSWSTNSTTAGGSLSLEPATGPAVYSMDGVEGTGEVQLDSGVVYSFFFCGSATEHVQISGTLTYDAPLI